MSEMELCSLPDDSAVLYLCVCPTRLYLQPFHKYNVLHHVFSDQYGTSAMHTHFLQCVLATSLASIHAGTYVMSDFGHKTKWPISSRYLINFPHFSSKKVRVDFLKYLLIHLTIYSGPLFIRPHLFLLYSMYSIKQVLDKSG